MQPDNTRTSRRPNIILILADDLDVGSLEYMPLLKAQMIDEGVTFENAFVTNPICCPSRATILRGQYSHNHLVWTNRNDGGFAKFHESGLEDSTIATWLQAGGYRTALVGKYLNHYGKVFDSSGVTHVPPGWDEWYGLGLGDYEEFKLNENGETVFYKGENIYQTDVFRDKAVDFIERRAGGDQPFFLYLAANAPHEPATAAPRHRNLKGKFGETKAPRPPSFDEEDVSDKPEWIRNRAPLTSEQTAKFDKQYRRRIRSLMAVDEMIESLVETLRESGELENTYIMFSSDHGLHMGQHRLDMGKWTAYEEDIRVPMIARGPGVPAGRVLEHLTISNDLAPTLAELAGVSPPEFVDGRSLIPLLADSPPSAADWRSAVLVEAPRGGGYKRPPYRALRTADHVYVEYGSGELELYDLREDPYQLDSLHESADSELLTRLAARLEALRECTGEGCRVAEKGEGDHRPD